MTDFLDGKPCQCAECVQGPSQRAPESAAAIVPPASNQPGDATEAKCSVRPNEQAPDSGAYFPRTALGSTDALGYSRDESEAARASGGVHAFTVCAVANDRGAGAQVPRGAHCDDCEQPVGSWSRVHFARVGDARACPGSWPRPRTTKGATNG